ncbi:MAG TPA: hypothetical protein VK850_07260 [Candidatus Binatia bacterium]|nr:hypothetical protein [Candidatus Binatia bacterium]
MAPSKRFFSEWNAINLFVLGTVILCIGVLSFKDQKPIVSPWFTVGFAILLYLGSWLLWNRGKYGQWRRRSRAQTFTHRNPPATLPPVRE